MKLIEISDLGLASALVTKGKQLRKIVKKGRYLNFYFDDTNEIKELIEAYYRDALMVPAKRLFQEYKSLKQAKFSYVKEENDQIDVNFSES